MFYYYFKKSISLCLMVGKSLKLIYIYKYLNKNDYNFINDLNI